jgi:hypothetical protein
MADRYWVGGAGTWNAANTANWSDTSGGAGGFSVPTSLDDVYFDAASNATGYTVTTAGNTTDMVCRSLSVAPPASGNVTFSNTNSTIQIFGSFTHTASGVNWGASVSFTFAAITTGHTVTTNGFSFTNVWIFNGVGGGWTLQDSFTTAANRSVQLLNGSVDLNDNTITCGFFSSNVNNTRTLAFGTGKIVVTGNNVTVFSLSATNLTVSGSRRIELTYAGAVGTRTLGLVASVTEATAFDFYVLAGTDIVTTTGNLRGARDLDFTGFAGTYTLNVGSTVGIFGDLTFSAGMTLSAATIGIEFRGSTGTQTVTANGKTFDFPVGVASTGSTVEFVEALTLGATRTLTLTSGTVEFLAGSTNTAGTFAIAGSPSVTLQSSIPGTQYTLSQASGTVNASNMTVSDSNVTGGATWNAFVSQGNVDAGNNTGWDFLVQIGRYIYTRRKNKRILP